MSAAVEVRNGYKYYGSKSKPKIILNYLNMNVQRGSIYGLLGASGCGKTTLLSCIVGQRQFNSGDVRVLGLKPGAPGSGIPGSRIGYMPQEIALVEEMTVKETVYYFGRIYGMKDDKIREKFKILRDLLQLPPATQLVKKCSGGQQRRVSFACAMIHDPELLILDEPTVGLDPMLREKIWEFLVETTRNSKMAVIITTHYIEEAKQANCIGLMRKGVLLAEDTPENIMLRFEVNSIEDAFLILSQKQGDNDVIEASLAQLPSQQQHHHNSNAICNGVEVIDASSIMQPTEKSMSEKPPQQIEEEDNDNTKKCFFTTKGRIKALMTKNFVQLFRQPSGIIFMLLFPIIQLSCFYMAVGKTPTNLKIGIVNDEVRQWESCYNPDLITVTPANDTCYFSNLSCRYITGLEGSDHLHRVFYSNLEEAHRDAKKAKILGYVYFARNFSTSMQTFLEDGRYAEDDAIDNSQVTVHLDNTDRQISYYLERKLREVYGSFIKEVVSDCNYSPSLASIPVNMQEPIYGTEDMEFQRYVAPGVVMTMVFFLATLMTASVFIEERLDGVWDRTLVAGVSAIQMLWAHLLTQFIIMVAQSIEVIVYIGLVFDTYNKGDTTTLIFLLTLTSFCGMLFGLLISVYCKSHTEANFVATGAFYPMIILCGLLWPLEGMPKALQDVVLYFPFTLPSISARNILEKGWDITNGKVYGGFLVMAAWIVIFFTLCMVGLKRKA
ncbi:ABC transporter G family member 20 [Musca vetustissima]|uniref:ABC transporter G family member 20 n=1 Tax=Musca vetustissima TaxID=27455 RepID=UPI002AB75284|nr:ABC transporter G family member 20 [Musca vetustissima]